jgi:heme exporter protein B
LNVLARLLRREIALAWGRGGGPLLALGFYAGVVTLAPLAAGPDPKHLAVVAAGVAWVGLARSTCWRSDRSRSKPSRR